MGFGDLFKTREFKTKISDLENECTQLKCALQNSQQQEKLGKTLESELNNQIVMLRESLANSKKQICELNQLLTPEMQDVILIRQKIAALESDKNELEQQLESINNNISECLTQKQGLEEENKQFISNQKALQKNKEILKSIRYAIKKLNDSDNEPNILSDELIADAENALSPTSLLKLQCMDVRQLRGEFTKNQRLIKETLAKYQGRYTVKVHAALYSLMVIALEAELQNILINIRYNKLEKSVHDLKLMTDKYQKIAIEGNQSIAPTIKKFIGEIEYYFLRAVEIEYEYYVQKERTKEEQRAIREQLKQDAKERKELEAQRVHIEKEEKKYNQEIENLQTSLESETDQTKINDLIARISQLQEQLENVNHIKDEILKLQMGKAGNIYIISNKGSFGENVFKIGMTRRLDPLDRVNELGSASVPFPFDVHAFIFSEDAVALEHSLHERLNEKRVNKVNRRKEFFAVDIDELEDIVSELDPTAEFNKTMIAEQYNQSLSIDIVPDENTINLFADNFNDEEE